MTFRLSQNKDGSYAVFTLTNDSFLCNIPTATNIPPENKVQVSLLNGKKRKSTEIINELPQSKPRPGSVKEANRRREQKRENDNVTGYTRRFGNTNNSSPSKCSSDQRLLRRSCTQNERVTHKPSTKKPTTSKVTLKKPFPQEKNVFKYDAPPSSPEPDEECIDTDPFMRMLNLVPSDKNLEHFETKRKYPMRRISRLPQDESVSSSRNQTLCGLTIYDLVEDLDVCSPLINSGIVPLTNVFLNPGQLSKAINNYEHYCQTVEATLLVRSKGLTHQLRSRESILKFNVTYKPPKQVDKKSSHLYTFSVRQRHQRYKRLKTGLSKQAEWLLKRCKKVEIILKKLNQKTIEVHTIRKPTKDVQILENKCIVAPTQSSNSFRILQPVVTDVRENKEVVNLRHTLLDSDVAYFFGSQHRSIADEMRITKGHDWLNLVENCSPSNNSSTKDLKPRKRLNSNGSLMAPPNRRAKQMGLNAPISDWRQDGESEISIKKFFHNNQYPKISTPNDKMQQGPKRLSLCDGNSFFVARDLQISHVRLIQKVPMISVLKTGS